MYTVGPTLFLCFLVLAAVACKPEGAKLQAREACTLLSPADIQAVQGEAVSDTNGSERSTVPLITSQCFYRLPTFNKSVSLEVMRPDGSPESARAADEFWERRFGKPADAEEAEKPAAERNKEKESNGELKALRDEREEGERARPEHVPGLGDSAFWTGSQINGSLYVRKKNTVIRLSLGGPDDQATKINKARTLAEHVLSHL